MPPEVSPTRGDSGLSRERARRATPAAFGKVPPLYIKACVLLVVAASLIWFGLAAKTLIFSYPPIWSDEACFASPAISLLRSGTLATEVLEGVLPGIGQRTYWQPPLYFLYIAAVFRFTGPGLLPLRLASLAIAPLVLGLAYLLALRAGLSRWLSLLAVALIAIDPLFLRGALIGRMDMLALALILLSLWLATQVFYGEVGPSRSLFAGLASGLAALTHPMGVVALASITVAYLCSPKTRKVRLLVFLFLGVLLTFLPWVGYILLDPRGFIAQMGLQFGKIARLSPGTVLSHLIVYMAQYYGVLGGMMVGGLLILPVWIGGFAGIAHSIRLAKRPEIGHARQCLLLLCLCQGLFFALAMWARDIWYVLYFIPITALGLILLVANGLASLSPGPARTCCASLLMLLIAGYVYTSVNHTKRLEYLENEQYQSGTEYDSWCALISREIPHGARVFLSVIPDPYFGLLGRSDLRLREFVPPGVPVSYAAYSSFLLQADYIVVGVGHGSPSPFVEQFVKSSGTLVGMVGKDLHSDYCYLARVYRVNKANSTRLYIGGGPARDGPTATNSELQLSGALSLSPNNL